MWINPLGPVTGREPWVGMMTIDFHRGGLLAAAILAGGTLPLAAQSPAAIRGVVRDSADGAPLPRADVWLDARVERRTNARGEFRFDSVAPGPHRLEVRRPGYAPRAHDLVLVAGRDLTVDLRLGAVATVLAPVVVTATRDARSLADVPVAVSVADSVTIASGRTAGLHEVLRLTPGMQATSRFGLDDVNLSIRGSGVRTTFGVRGVAVVVDGVPVTEPDGQTRLDMLELGNARQVEVVRGPASALYGGTAAGGVVNIISRSPLDSRGLTARLSTGSFGFRKYDGTLGAASSNGRLGAYLEGTWTASDGFRAHNTNLIKRLNLRSEWQPTAATRLALEASTSDLDMKIPGALTQAEFAATPDAAEPVTVQNDYGRRDVRWRAGLKLEQDIGLLGRTARLNAYGFYGGRELNHPIFQVLDQNLHRTQAGARLMVPLGGAAWRWTMGSDYDILYGSSDRYVNVGGERGAQTIAQENRLPTVGIFGQLEGALAPTLTFTVAARWDRVEYGVVDHLVPGNSASPAFTQVSPKATLSYAVTPATHLYATVARGFDVPTLSEKTATADPRGGFNAGLEPKRLWNQEVGLKSMVGGQLLVDGSVFHQQVTGEILPFQETVVGENRTVTIYQNAGRSRNWGAELALTAYLGPRVDLGASYTWSDFVLQEFSGPVTGPDGSTALVDFAGRHLPGVPMHRLAAEVRWRPLPGLQLGTTAEWQSRVYVDNANTVDGSVYVRGFGPNPTVTEVPFSAIDPWGLVHVNASYRVGQQTVFFNVENLFNTRYAANATLNASNGRFYSAGAGRYVAAGVTVHAFGGAW
jgi:iron complex outermembrane receptor protein